MDFTTFPIPFQIRFIGEGSEMVCRVDGYEYTFFKYGQRFMWSQENCNDRNASLAGLQTQLDQKVFNAAM